MILVDTLYSSVSDDNPPGARLPPANKPEEEFVPPDAPSALAIPKVAELVVQVDPL